MILTARDQDGHKPWLSIYCTQTIDLTRYHIHLPPFRILCFCREDHDIVTLLLLAMCVIQLTDTIGQEEEYTGSVDRVLVMVSPFAR
jgi:hypothetical protein